MQNQPETVTFNVGGTRFTTAVSNLSKYEKENMLLALYSNTKDHTKEIFIDRLSDKFGILFDYLRTGDVPEYSLALYKEADYYGFVHLLELYKQEYGTRKRKRLSYMLVEDDEIPTFRANATITLYFESGNSLATDFVRIRVLMDLLDCKIIMLERESWVELIAKCKEPKLDYQQIGCIILFGNTHLSLKIPDDRDAAVNKIFTECHKLIKKESKLELID